MYFAEIFSLITWPAVIFITYHLVRLALKRYEDIFPEDAEDVS